ncbi:MAG TPA: hypothetical protein VFM29_08980 [Vicinamibacteria bacterium]|nr:hypothetical protein [Vicinamibacteria bacterium]
MADRRPADAPVGHSDSPRQDTQRPDHGDHPDAGGQESTNSRAGRTQLRPGDTPPGVEPPTGTLQADAPVPQAGRQPERPGQPGVLQERLGQRDAETMDPQRGNRDPGDGIGGPEPR